MNSKYMFQIVLLVNCEDICLNDLGNTTKFMIQDGRIPKCSTENSVSIYYNGNKMSCNK
jgi:hypothetical protein